VACADSDRVALFFLHSVQLSLTLAAGGVATGKTALLPVCLLPPERFFPAKVMGSAHSTIRTPVVRAGLPAKVPLAKKANLHASFPFARTRVFLTFDVHDWSAAVKAADYYF